MIMVRGRNLIIPVSERQIGTTYDNNSEVRYIRIDRVMARGIDISHLSFRLDLEYGNDVMDTCMVEKEVQEEYILLIWEIPRSCVSIAGTVWVSIRGYDENGTIKWATNKGALYVEKTASGETSEKNLTEMEQLEQRIDEKINALDQNEDERNRAEEERRENERKRLNNEAYWQELAESAITLARKTLDDAEKAATNAEKNASNAASSAESADHSNKLAESYARGGTGVREGEDTDCAKFYYEKAKEEAEKSSFDGKAVSVSAVDISGVLGEAGAKSDVQSLLNAVAVPDARTAITGLKTGIKLPELLSKVKAALMGLVTLGEMRALLINNGLTTEAGKYFLDAAFGKTLADMIGDTSQLPNSAANLAEAVVALNNNSKGWIFLNEVTGKEKVYFPDDFNEILVSVVLSANSTIRYSILFPKDELSADEERNFRSGSYASAQSYAQVVVMATSSYIYLSNYINTGSNATTDSKIRVYYR